MSGWWSWRTGIAALVLLLAVLILLTLRRRVGPASNRQTVDLDPAAMPWTGQNLSVGLIRPSEVWQFCAFMFAAFLTLSYALVEDFDSCLRALAQQLGAPIWGKAALHVALFLLWFYVFMVDRCVRAFLVRCLNRIKLEPY